ncbi:ATP-binding cassette domain-containing protein [Corynebacterium liangguodongii]|uniref:ABC transporter ATP-binding protein n=1 Tax=Corynebacterium liangguodongii TaxID=2079535 RepID=A0A2S0WGG9_9CORY|nr:ATP-binding cassette domain-containing protein [Corynebacterium liangguodongii]AWB84888.1 ABC transporter ATP-binding protein [Corynebacterium liangguodongii]PWB99404.1 ABC transporter ATP-binding protein [Corynebacterium liangguodongii]
MITARNLTKSYRKKDVLTGVDLDLEAGGIHGLLGRNGVGKSTLLGIIGGQIKASSGELRVFGEQPWDNARVMDAVALTGVDTPYPGAWSGAAILEAAGLRYPRWDEDGARSLVDDFALTGALETRYSFMSRGQKAMIGIVVGLASCAPLTLLDEPYVGLDTHNRRVFYEHLLAMGESGRTFIVATHHVHESAKVLDSFLILGRDGRIARHCNAADVADEYVVLSAPALPRIDEALDLRGSAGLQRALVPRSAAAGVGVVRKDTADLDDVIGAMLEAS